MNRLAFVMPFAATAAFSVGCGPEAGPAEVPETTIPMPAEPPTASTPGVEEGGEAPAPAAPAAAPPNASSGDCPNEFWATV